MGVKKNKNLRKQRITLSLIMISIFLIIIFGAIFVYLYSQNYINYGPTDMTIKTQEAENSIVQDADIILLNNILLGGTNGKEWISASRMYEKLIESHGEEITMFSKEGNLGRYETASFKMLDNVYYTKATKYPTPDEYIAVGNNKTEPIYMSPKEIETNTSDIKKVKNALGKYKWLNGSVKIVEAYQTSFANGELGTIYSITSDGGNIFGVYSAVVFSYGKEDYLIKYSYVKDTELSKAWPVYDIKHVVDINCDGKNELILQETTATEVTYLVEEYIDNGKFNEVLRVTIDI